MARRKHRRHSSRRRRVGAATGMKGALTKVAGIAAGVFAGRLVSTKLAASMDPKIVGLVLVVGGVMVPRFIKSDIGQGIGDGLSATGVLSVLTGFGVISGSNVLPPGQTATIRTGDNGYNAANARTVGAGPRQIMKSTVGMLNGIPRGTLHQIGALFEE